MLKFAATLLLGASACARSMHGVPTTEAHAHHDGLPEQLGKVSFPISCVPEVQQQFERGVALLHSFGYEEAEKQFRNIASEDPQCAIAHWGIAMTLFHQIWERPQENALRRGWEELQAAEKIGARSERERSYISALDEFYRDSSSRDHLTRAAAYSAAMERLQEKYPADLEAGAFYALSLLAAERPDDTSLTNEKKAVEVLNKLFQREPDHPGLAHYIIHSCDSPELALMGLAAARRYAEIAPSSAHALHMPSHIFARLGLWQEDIQANLRSVAHAHASDATYMRGHELHAMHFLLYAYLQIGQDEAARRILEESKRVVAQSTRSGSEDVSGMQYYDFAAAHFPAMYALEMHRWADAAALEPPSDAAVYVRGITYWARTIGAARSGNVEATRRDARKYDEQEEAIRRSKYAYMLEGPHFARDEVHAWLAFAEKRNDEALSLMRQVSDAQDKIGKSEVDIPAREMLADMLLELNKPEEALGEYERSMRIDPNRFNGLSGAARSAELAHDPEKAKTYHGRLLKNCDDGRNSDRPELSQAKRP